jgi:hypothetical protein
MQCVQRSVGRLIHCRLTFNSEALSSRNEVLHCGHALLKHLHLPGSELHVVTLSFGGFMFCFPEGNGIEDLAIDEEIMSTDS